MNGFYYVYILANETNDKAHYSGITRNLNARLSEHNRGKCPHTAKYKPWKIETAVAFRPERKLAVLNAI
jgi:predicted GIY-YIG superfamily endonuclease